MPHVGVIKVSHNIWMAPGIIRLACCKHMKVLWRFSDRFCLKVFLISINLIKWPSNKFSFFLLSLLSRNLDLLSNWLSDKTKFPFLLQLFVLGHVYESSCPNVFQLSVKVSILPTILKKLPTFMKFKNLVSDLY